MRHFDNIQGLRAVAAILVVIYHVSVIGKSPIPAFDAGRAGVDIFFVISGFIMWTTARNSEATSFVLRRIIRIVPLYWAITVSMFFISIDNGVSLRFDGDIEGLIKSLGFIAYEKTGSTPLVSPILSPGWTLNLEMFFYLIFAVGLAVFRKYLAPFIILVLLALTAIGFLAPQQGPVAAFYLNSIVFEFALGILLGIAVTRGIDLPKGWPAVILGLAGAALIFSNVIQSGYRLFDYGIGAFLILVAAVGLEGSLNRRVAAWSTLLGDASYAIYLVHVLVIAVLNRSFSILKIPRDIATDTVMILACVGIGIALHFMFDNPVQTFLRRFLPRRSAPGKLA